MEDMEEEKPYPVMLLANEAFLHTKALESSGTEGEFEREEYQSGDVRFQNSTDGLKTEGCELENIWPGPSYENAVELQNKELINDSNQIKNKSEITQKDTDSLVSSSIVNVEVKVERNGEECFMVNDSNQMKCENQIQGLADSLIFSDAVNVEVKIERHEEECFMVNNSNQIKCESEITQKDTDSYVSNDAVKVEVKVERNEEERFLVNDSNQIIVGNDDFDSNAFPAMESEKAQNQASSSDCYEIYLDRDEKADFSFSSSDNTSNTDASKMTCHETSTELYSDKQKLFKECRVFLGLRIDKVSQELWENSEKGILSSSTQSYNKRIVSDRRDKLYDTMTIQVRDTDQIKKFPEFPNVITDTDNVGLVKGDPYLAAAEANDNNAQLEIYQDDHNSDKLYICTVCGKAFAQKSTLTTHMRYHTGEQPFKCTVCSKAFTQKSNCTNHIVRCHTGEKPYKCIVCDNAFSRHSNLTKHVRFHTGEKPYSCTVCSKAFAKNNFLTAHMRCHTGEKPYKCTVCGKAFTQISTLTAHMRCHTGEKPYKCTVCGEAFAQKSTITTHMRYHTGEKPFKCTVCSQAFAQKSVLTEHTRCHTGEKPYKCAVCGEVFAQRFSFKCHMRCHTGEKPYKCTVCSKAFTQKSNCTQHIVRCHTGEKPYKCTVCDNAFSRHSNLTKHLRCHTREKPV